MKTLELKRFGKLYTVTLVPACYMNNRSLAIQIMYRDGQDWEPYGTLTTNLSGAPEKNKAYVDINNLGAEVLGWIKENGLGEPTGKMKKSGFCQYPEVKFNEEALKQFDSPDYEQYLANFETLKEGEVYLYPTCEMCGKVYPTIVTKKQADMYEEYVHSRKYLIQDVFPDMPNEIRGLFAIGQHICGTCWKNMFGFFEDEDDEDEYEEEDFQ